MKEWRFVSLCLLLGCLIFFSLNLFAKALQPVSISMNDNLGGWKIEAISTEFDVIHAVSKESVWALDQDNSLPDRIYRYDGNIWQLQHAFGTNEKIRQVDMISDSDGWAFGRIHAGVGTGGTGALWRYDGHSWNRFSTPVDQHIFALDMRSSTEGWALGADSLLKFDGIKWKEVGLGLKLSYANRTEYDLTVFSETEAWVHYAPYPAGSVYFYDGVAWELVSDLSWISSFTMISSTDGWASRNSSFDEQIFHYDGVQWSNETFIGFRGIDEFSVVSSDNIWAVSGHQALHYDGKEWAVMGLPNDASTQSISMANDESGWILDNDNKLLEYVNGAWQARDFDTKPIQITTRGLRNVKMNSTGLGWIPGTQHFNNDRWEAHVLHPESANFIKEISGISIVTPTSLYLSTFDVSPVDQGWAVGSISYRYRSAEDRFELDDSLQPVLFELDSSIWKPVNTLSTEFYSAFDVLSDQSIWSTSPTIRNEPLQHYDGNNWQGYPLSDFTLSLFDIQMLSANNGWAVGSSARMMSTNDLPYLFSAVIKFDGTDWTTVESTPGRELYAIDMISETEGWTVGAEGTILHYVNGSWIQQPSPVDINLYDVDMVSSDEGWAIGRDNTVLGPDFIVCRSTILRYTNAVWQVVGSFDGPCLRKISVPNSHTGLIVGDNGTVLKLFDQTTILPTSASELTIQEQQGRKATIQIPTNAVDTSTTLVYKPLTPHPPPSGMLQVEPSFTLQAYRGDDELAAFDFAQPVIITLEYGSRLSSPNEESMALMAWDGQQWIDAASTCPTSAEPIHDMEANRLSVAICRTTDFGLFMERGPSIYLPFISDR